MDLERLIEAVKLCGRTPKADQCKQCAYWAGGDMSRCIPNMTSAAATALSTLRAEDEKLRNELEQVKREKDAAVEDLRRNRKYKCSCCAYAKSENPFICRDCWDRIGGAGDAWQWRGAEKG